MRRKAPTSPDPSLRSGRHRLLPAGGPESKSDDKEALLIATRNPGKLRELTSLLVGCPLKLVSLDDVGVDVDVQETGSTFEENATLKADTYSRLTGMVTLADDSGLEVDALRGEPGVMSSRYAGEGASDQERIAFLLRKLDNIPEDRRKARFRCVIAVARPGAQTELYPGECQGTIIDTPRGRNGFGYDPVFVLPKLGRTMAELSEEEKDLVSHRGIAARKAVAALGLRDA